MNFRFPPEQPDKKGVYFVYVPEYISADETEPQTISTCFKFVLYDNSHWAIDVDHNESFVKAWIPISELYDDLNRNKNSSRGA